MTTTHWTDALAAMDACDDAVAWARAYPDLPSAWAACERADWMLWLAGRTLPLPAVVLATCASVRPSLRHVPAGETRPLAALEAAEAWARDPCPRTAAATRAAAWAADAAAWATWAKERRAMCDTVRAALPCPTLDPRRSP